MTTQIVFAIHSDDEELRELTKDLDPHMSDYWRLAVFCCQQQLEKAIARDAVQEHYNSIHMRAKATRGAKREQTTEPG
jgi:DNA-directed RNA polymerase specialized sigma24 family protein